MKLLRAVFSAVLAVFLLTSCGVDEIADAADIIDRINRKAPSDWYQKTLNYYVYGVSTGWANETLYGDLTDEIKDPDNRFGYYLVDLNGDGGMEFMVGYVDDEDVTRFTDLYIYHPDFKHEYHSFSSGDGYYLYLCEVNILRSDSRKGHDTTEYMTMNKNPVDGFLIQEFDDPPKALKCDLIPFDEAEMK